jgi:hypothetical protein
VTRVPEKVRADFLSELNDRQLAPRPGEVAFVDAPRVQVRRQGRRHIQILAAHHRHEGLRGEQDLPAVIQVEVVVARIPLIESWAADRPQLEGRVGSLPCRRDDGALRREEFKTSRGFDPHLARRHFEFECSIRVGKQHAILSVEPCLLAGCKCRMAAGISHADAGWHRARTWHPRPYGQRRGRRIPVPRRRHHCLGHATAAADPPQAEHAGGIRAGEIQMLIVGAPCRHHGMSAARDDCGERTAVDVDQLQRPGSAR